MTNDALVPAREGKPADRLQNDRVDYLVSSVRAAAGAVPFVGNAIAELLTVAIPKQRIDRIADVVGRLAEKIDEAQADIDRLTDRFKMSEFGDIFEEGMLQAGRALSEERRQYLANVLFMGLSEEALDHARVKKLLFILDDLLDQEIVWLAYLNLGIGDEAEEFYEIHRGVLEPVTAVIGSDQDELDSAALQEAYQHRLTQLGLVENETAVTPLGRLLLRYIEAIDARDPDDGDGT